MHNKFKMRKTEFYRIREMKSVSYLKQNLINYAQTAYPIFVTQIHDHTSRQ